VGEESGKKNEISIMDLYITVEDKTKLKKAFLNLRKQQVIVVDEVIIDLGYDPAKIDDYSSFIVNEKIKKIIGSTASGKKMQSIIYVNDKVNDLVIRELIHHCQDNTPIGKVIFLTEKNKNEEFFELFEEVVFFPTVKKVHIIDCVPVPTNWPTEFE
jgi:hypothetical protein